jgi:hypothetical protein
LKKFAILAAVILFVTPACAGNTARLDIAPVAEVPIATATTFPVATATNMPVAPTVTTQPMQASSSAAPATGPSATPTHLPTPTPDIDWATVTGRTTEGLNYRGNPQAPVTMIDFSDFM